MQHRRRAQRWIATALVLISIAAVVIVCREALYPHDLSRNEAAYQKLVRLTLACCSDGDYMADRDRLERRDPERAALMRALGVDAVHYYPGNEVHPGAAVFLERNPGPLSAMYVYSVEGGPKRITGCYTTEHVQANWYRGHSLPCLLSRD